MLTYLEYEAALLRIDQLMDADPNSDEEIELNRLADLIIEYEDYHFPIDTAGSEEI